jgi:hypothetical protein
MKKLLAVLTIGLSAIVVGCSYPKLEPLPSLGSCEVSADCVESAGTPVCDNWRCVQCTQAESEACGGSTPTCGPDNQCLACSSHDQCSTACTPSGACAEPTQVAYVDSAGTDNADCTHNAACTKVSSALATNRPYVLFKGTITENVLLTSRKNLSFLGFPGARLKASAIGPVIRIQNDSTLTIVDLEIAEGANNTSHGILSNSSSLDLRRVKILKNLGIGVLAQNSSIKITQSIFIDNVGGGLSVEGSTFEVINNIFFRNGGVSSSLGGVSFLNITATGNKFEFNTVTQNMGGNGAIGGVQCEVINVSSPMGNSIVYGNMQFGVTDPDQVGMSNFCSWSHSIIGPKPFTRGTEVRNENPQFQGEGIFLLTPSSPAINTAAPDTNLPVDFYGNPRPVGGRADIGAIEMQ